MHKVPYKEWEEVEIQCFSSLNLNVCGYLVNFFLLPSAVVVVDGKPVRLQLCDVSGEVVFILILNYFNHN